MSLPRVVYRGTVEYIEATVRVKRPAGAVLDTQPVFMALDDQTFVAAEWEGDPGPVRVCSALAADLGLPTTRGRAKVFVRLNDTTESPIVPAGTLFIRNR